MLVKVVDPEQEITDYNSLHKRIDDSFKGRNQYDCVLIAEKLYSLFIRLYSAEVLLLSEFVKLVAYIDASLHNRFGQDIVCLGSFRNFYLCKAVSYGLLDGESINGCHECSYLMTCHSLFETKEINSDNLAERFILLSVV